MIRLFGLDAMSLRALQKHYYQAIRHDAARADDRAWDRRRNLSELCPRRRPLVAAPNHSLAAAIAALPGRKLILTNGSRDHAVDTAKQLAIDHIFEDVFDIVAADFIAKPDEGAYVRFFERMAWNRRVRRCSRT